MIKRDVNFCKGKIKGLVAISRKYWDKGKLTTNNENILLKGKKSTFEIAINDIKDIELVRRRTFKVLKIIMHYDDFYHVSCIPDKTAAPGGDTMEWIAEMTGEVIAKNEKLYNDLQKLLNL